LVAFIVPYVFVYNEGLMMQGNIFGILTVSTLLLICVILSAGALSGYLFNKMSPVWRIATLTIALLAAFLCTFREITHQPLVFLASISFLLVLSVLLFKSNKRMQSDTVPS